MVGRIRLKSKPSYSSKFNCVATTKESYLKAIDIFDKILRIKPLLKLVYNYRGITKWRLEKNKEAIKDLKKAIQIDPTYADAYYYRGIVRKSLYGFGTGENIFKINIEKWFESQGISNWERIYEKIIADFSKAIDLDPNHTRAYLSRAETKYFIGNLKEALVDYRNYLQNQTQADEFKICHIYSRCGDINMDLSKYQSAIEDYSKGIILDSFNTFENLYYSRGKAYMQLDRYDDAVKDLDKAYNGDPLMSFVLLDRAKAKKELGNYEGGERGYRTLQ